MGSVLFPLAKHRLKKKAPSLIDFILSSQQALHQYLTSSPWRLAEACLASRCSWARACHCSDTAKYRRFGLATGTGSESEERQAATALPLDLCSSACPACRAGNRQQLRPVDKEQKSLHWACMRAQFDLPAVTVPSVLHHPACPCPPLPPRSLSREVHVTGLWPGTSCPDGFGAGGLAAVVGTWAEHPGSSSAVKNQTRSLITRKTCNASSSSAEPAAWDVLVALTSLLCCCRTTDCA